MDKTSVLLVVALGGMVFFLTGRSLILERKLSSTGKEISGLKGRIRKLEDEKRGLEAELAESIQRIEAYERALGARQPQALAPILKKARRSIELCIPELTPEVAGMLPGKIDARIIASKIGNVGRLRFQCATNPTIDVSLAVIDGKAAYRMERGRTTKLRDAGRIKEGFETLWNNSTRLS